MVICSHSCQIFFAPMPEEAGLNATIVQKMIRFMVAESTVIADKASAVAVDAYVQRLYATVGAAGTETERQIKTDQLSANAQIPIYKAAFQGVCKTRYPAVSSFVGTPQRFQANYEGMDPDNVTTAGSGKQDITFDTCRLIEYRMMVQEEINSTNSLQLAKIQESFTSDKLEKTIQALNAYLQQQQNQLGWANAIIIPSTAMLMDSLPLVQDASLQGNNRTFSSTISGVMDSTTLAELTKEIKKEQIFRSGNNAADMGALIARYAYMAMPGASGLYRAFEKNQDDAIVIANALKANTVSASGVDISPKVADDRTYILATSQMYEWFLAKLPIAVSVIAGIIAFVGYIIELAKYYYISPFVVAFALTTKKTHKIVDFLVTGLAVFFKPILLVVFIALAVFVYTLVQDIFIHYTKDEFVVLMNIASAGSEAAEGKSPVSLVMSLLSTLIQILGSLGATYIMWKLINSKIIKIAI